MKKIMVIDNDLAILDCLTIILTEEGYHVITTSHGNGIQKALQTHQPDLILLDVRLSGGLDGGELARRLKNKEETKRIPIILISALSNVKKIAKEALADDYLIKPFEIDEVLYKVQQYVKD